MQQLLRTLSDLLESSRATITQDELSALTDEVRDAMLSLKILVPTRPAAHVVCDACHDDHIEEVVRIKSGKEVAFRLRCPDAGWVDVPVDRLRQWTMDVPRLTEVLANGVNPSGSVETIVTDSAWNLGSLEVAGNAFNVVLVRDRVDSPLASVTKRLPQQRTVIVRTGKATEMVEGYAATLSLPMAFAFNEGRLELQADQVRRVLVTESAAIGNVFQLRGEFWQLTFDGETKHFKDSVGLGYIARLLMEPNREIPAVTLLAARAGIDPLVTRGSSGEVLDDQARREYGDRYRELKVELDAAREINDLGRIAKVESEMEQLTNELANATGLGGRSRKKSDIEKVRKAVRERISGDIKRIQKSHPALGAHLDVCINTGTACRYEPNRQIDWLT